MPNLVQGTMYRITGTFRDPDTGNLFDPPDVVVAFAPSGGSTTVLRYSQQQVTKVKTGVYRAYIDTTPASGQWTWQIGSTGISAVKKKGYFTVDPALV